MIGREIKGGGRINREKRKKKRVGEAKEFALTLDFWLNVLI